MTKITDFNKRPRKGQATPAMVQARADQTKNEAGGYGWSTDMQTQLTRLFILGTTQPTYYTKAQKLAEKNLAVLKSACETHGADVLKLLIDIRQNNRSKSRETLLVGYAYLLAFGNLETKKAAYDALNVDFKVNLKQMLSLIGYAMNIRGSSRGLKNMIRRWFNNNSVSNLSFQLAKYTTGQGWTPRDLVRLAHVESNGNEELGLLLNYLKTNGESELPAGSKSAFRQLVGRAKAMASTDEKYIIDLIKEYGLSHEMIPSTFANNVNVWKTLLATMQPEAFLWNLSKFATMGLLDKSTTNAANLEHARRILNPTTLENAKVHPMRVYMAYQTYVRGRSVDHGRGVKSWGQNPEIADLLNDAFIALFKTQKPITGNVEVGIDVSGSMRGANVNGSDLTAVEGSAVVAYALCQTQPSAQFNAVAYDTSIHSFSMNKRSSLKEVTDKINKLVNGGTDCSLPILDALRNKRWVDTFVIITDANNWQGNIQPHQAMEQYAKINPNARLVVAQVCSNDTTIADPKNGRHMNVVGFDGNILDIIRDFANGDLG